ncbi:hypothetical protein DDZ13_07810 [Coraliomargarita sinensis]|uniref:Uncharacterized protein n=1 Tax=Coraliomargarita sinensis TaxID=2174842 RepID=A0A317ZKF3_9BACT|nr:hypothetical protein DDZ13_07810 [Coraliomargarita sinensis]
MASLPFVPTVLAALAASAVAVNATAIESWVVANGSATTSDLSTDSPTFGDGTADSAEDIFALGEFVRGSTLGTVLLANDL